MPFLPPNDSVPRIINLRRWQRDWINNHRSINFSGLVQELLVQIIKEKDPAYYEMYSYLLAGNYPKRKENIEPLLKQTHNPIII